MDPNLLVSYGRDAGYFAAKNEISAFLQVLGDKKPEMELLSGGLIGVRTSLNNRKVVEEMRERFIANPLAFNFTLKWVPIDYWCKQDLEAMKGIIREEIRDIVTGNDRWAMQVEKHKGEMHSKEIIEAIAPLIRGKVDLDHPDKIVRVDLFGDRAAITLLTPRDIFSVVKGV